MHLFGDKNSSARDAREMLVRSSDSFGLAWRRSLSVRNPNSFLMTGKYARSLTPATLCVFFKLAWTRLDSSGLVWGQQVSMRLSNSLGLAWTRLDSSWQSGLCLVAISLISSGQSICVSTCSLVDSSHLMCIFQTRLDSLGLVWGQQVSMRLSNSLGLVWTHQGNLGSVW